MRQFSLILTQFQSIRAVRYAFMGIRAAVPSSVTSSNIITPFIHQSVHQYITKTEMKKQKNHEKNACIFPENRVKYILGTSLRPTRIGRHTSMRR